MIFEEYTLFSSPELKAQVNFADQNLSIVHCRCHWYCCCSKLFTFSSSSQEPHSQFQPNLAQSILGWQGFKFDQMKGPVLVQGEIIMKEQKYIDEIKKNVLLQNHMTNFNQTGHKAFLGEGNSSLIKWRAQPFSKGRLLGNNKNTLMKFKNLLNNHWANYNQTCHSASSGEGYSSLFKWRTIQFSLSRYKFLLQHCDNHMSLWIWTVFSGEHCGPWASRFLLLE